MALAEYVSEGSGGVVDWLNLFSDQTLISEACYTLGDLPMDNRDFAKALKDMADEFDNFSEPTELFKSRAAEFMWKFMARCKEYQEAGE